MQISSCNRQDMGKYSRVLFTSSMVWVLYDYMSCSRVLCLYATTHHQCGQRGYGVSLKDPSLCRLTFFIVRGSLFCWLKNFQCRQRLGTTISQPEDDRIASTNDNKSNTHTHYLYTRWSIWCSLFCALDSLVTLFKGK